MTTWEPSPSDIRWGQMMLASITNGGYWCAPGPMQTYRFDHTNKTITLLASPDSPEHVSLHEKTQKLFRLLGYEVVDGRPSRTQSN